MPFPSAKAVTLVVKWYLAMRPQHPVVARGLLARNCPLAIQFTVKSDEVPSDKLFPIPLRRIAECDTFFNYFLMPASESCS
jgi:hypothetical protein